MGLGKITFIAIWITLVFLSGCSVPPSISLSNASSIGSSQVVIGGQQPVAHATIQLYSVGTSGDSSSAKPLLTKTVTTDANGSFSIVGLYSCANATEVYMTATGGNPLPNVTNTNLALMTALGSCASLNPTSPIVVNELTTIAAVNALAPYMSSYTTVGAGSEDGGALEAAFTLAGQLVNPATGASPGLGVPNGYAVPTDLLDTLGNAVASCVDSEGGAAGDDSACGTFFSFTTPSGIAPPSDTVEALLYLANDPELNTDSIYQLSSKSGPFQPQLPAAPLNFRIALVPTTPITGPAEISPSSINFPTTAVSSTSTPQRVTLANNTTSNLSVSGISITGADSVNFSETNDCPTILPMGASCTIAVMFAPQSTVTATATLQVNEGQFSVGLTGSGDLAASAAVTGALQLSPMSLNFPVTELGSVSQVQVLTLTNNTAGAVSISDILIAGTDSVDFVETNECPTVLVVGASCAIQVSFSPQSTVQSMATLQVNGGLVSAALSGPSKSPEWPTSLLAASPSVYLNFNDSTANFVDQISGATFSSGGSVTPLQPGFDDTQPNNKSAQFDSNAWTAAPNERMGAIDWNIPFSILMQIDRLNWSRTGSLVLMSKGDLGSGPGWELVLQMNGAFSQLCFYEYGTPGQNQGVCSNYGDAMPNGFNYDIIVTNNGTGANGAMGGGSYSGNVNAVSLYINGISDGAPVAIYGAGFGSISFTLSGGKGYADTTPITVTGGGPNCTVLNYEMLATNGVPTRIINSASGNPNYGCTSIPTVSLTSPTGAGAVITPSLTALTMNSMNPLMAPGYVSGSVKYGIAGTSSARNSVYVDEAAIFPGVLSPSQIGAMYYQTKFYQGLLGTRPAVPPAVVFDDDGCGDLDNTWALEETIALHQLGFINLEGVIQEDNGTGNVAYYRQQLDQAGLASVPIGIPANAPSYSACNTTALNTFDATTLEQTDYPTASQVYRQVFAANPTAPVSIIIGAPLDGLANFMQSPSDSISSLTGAQLFARNALNGGVLYSQGGGCTSSSLPAMTPCTGDIGAQVHDTTSYADAAYVYANGVTMPMIAVGGTPAPAGPGPLVTRTSKDPTYLQMSYFGTDMRMAWDSLPVSALVTPYFYGGVNVNYSGGTGYENSTLFTSTGGGPNCNVTGYMTANGGVPNGITTLWGTIPAEDESGVVAGLGYGCTSTPTLILVSPTGTGVTLSAYPTTVCVTTSFPGYSSGQSSASGTCNKRYQSSLSQWALPGYNAPVFRWFLNSLVDPPSD